MSDDEDSITEEQVRAGFEDIYGVTVEEVMGVLERCLEEDHRLLTRMKEAGEAFEEAGFTEAEKDSMRGIRDYVDERDDS